MNVGCAGKRRQQEVRRRKEKKKTKRRRKTDSHDSLALRRRKTRTKVAQHSVTNGGTWTHAGADPLSSASHVSDEPMERNQRRGGIKKTQSEKTARRAVFFSHFQRHSSSVGCLRHF